MDADNASVPETQKPGISASTELTPADRPEFAISGIREEVGSREPSLQLVGGNKARQLSVVLEGTVARATKYGHTFALLVPQNLIPEHEREDVLEVKVARVSELGREYVLYTTHLPGYKRAYLDLFQLGAAYLEEFVILSVRRYRAEEFSAEYNSAKPGGLENTELLWKGGFSLKVDDVMVDLREAKFRAYQGMVLLDCLIGRAGAIKIQKNVGAFEVRLKDHSPVKSILVKAGGVVMTYSRTDHDAYPHRRQVVAGEATQIIRSSAWESSLKFAIRGPWRDAKNVFVVEAGGQTIALVRARLASTRTLNEFRKMKGDIGEEIVRQVLSGVAMTLVADHPFNHQPWLVGSERPGPDLLIRMNPLNRLYYVEVKWWGDTDEAYSEAKDQVLEDWGNHPEFEGEMVMGCYVAIVDWKAENDEILLQVVRIPSKRRWA